MLRVHFQVRVGVFSCQDIYVICRLGGPYSENCDRVKNCNRGPYSEKL